MAELSDETLYEVLAGLLPLLERLKAELSADTPRPLTVVAGQGRGSKKPSARLRSVEIIPESRKA